eukprot:CAMPEP_0119534678 /NCGR_PEP_ID=MMETSP1344-20130328/47867_1 /TAXON_ID=236787 /ORGANISM="Florenciella parvula, Strain CCMP2471" /LENGTH=51 /DNA_ID=CAMNT_0007576017 /DNA_START=1212 /DNA_END=1367 /DNA_ORIENTATION=+
MRDIASELKAPGGNERTRCRPPNDTSTTSSFGQGGALVSHLSDIIRGLGRS